MTDEGFHAGFERAEGHRRLLRGIVEDVTAVADGLKAASVPVLRKIDERVASDVFRVMVIGEFKRGKTTLINAMLGADILPAYSRPATAVLTELRWSATPVAVLYPIDGGAPVEVRMADLAQQITVHKGVRQGAADTSAWKLAVVGWPLDLLRNGVVLIDSPGLNEHPTRQLAMLEYLSRADAIVFVQDIQHPVSVEEVRFLEAYLDTYDVFFVFNKINFISDDEVAEVKEDALYRLKLHRDEQRRDRCYFVNALAALRARVEGDDVGWRASAVAGFVEELSTFLATERHWAKLIGPARETGREIRLLRQAAQEQRELIEQTEADLRWRYEKAQAPLRRLEADAWQIREELELSAQHVQSVIRAEVASRLEKISAEIPEIIAETVPDTELSLRPGRTQASAEAYARELSARASAEAELRFKTWQKRELAPIVEPDLAAMAHRADELVREFMRDLASVREGLTGVDHSAAEELSGLDATGSIASADLAGGLTGGLAARHLMEQFPAISGVALVGAFTPFGLVPLVTGVLLANSAVLGFARGRTEQKVRREVSIVLANKMREDAGANAEKSAAAFGATLDAAIGELTSRVDGELRQFQIQVEDALHAGVDVVKQQHLQLADWETVLARSAVAVEDLISDVALT